MQLTRNKPNLKPLDNKRYPVNNKMSLAGWLILIIGSLIACGALVLIAWIVLTGIR